MTRKVPPRILLVDGDETFSKSLARALKPHALLVEALSDGRTAIARLTNERFDVVVIDLDLKPLGGWPIIQFCSSLPKPRPVLLASGTFDVPTAVRAVRCGVADVVAKPYTAEKLMQQIDEALGTRAAADEAAAPPESVSDSATQILGDSSTMRRVREQIRNAARFPDLGVLIVGESGTGKELVAEAVHELTSPDQPFSTVSCASIPEALFETELFGHETTSSTGARTERAGLFETAGRGTLFLAEVEAVPLALRAKLLRALETRRFRRVGAARESELRARVVCATARSFSGEPDTSVDPFLHRLATFTIGVPALRDRAEDVALLASHFAEQFGARNDARKRVTQDAIEALSAYEWPGNVRELRSVLEHAHVRAKGSTIDIAEVAAAIADRRATPRRGDLGSGNYQRPFVGPAPDAADVPPEGRRHSSSLRELERDLVVEAYRLTDSISEAARRLGISRSTLREKLKKYGLRGGGGSQNG